MTHEQLVEKVARAIYAKRDPLNCDPWDVAMARKATMGRTDTPMVAEAKEAARAAIAAIAEALDDPPPAMIDAAVDAWHHAPGLLDDQMRSVLRTALAASPLVQEEKQ